MHRFRWKRRRIAALALLPFAAITAATSVTVAAAVSAGVDPTALTASPSSVKLRIGKHHLHADRRVALSGTVNPGGRHAVVIQVNGARVAKVTSASNGKFRAGWRAGRPGVYRIAAFAIREGAAPVASKAGRINAYRAVQASYYGPGLYGGHMACGGTLKPSTKGVAHKTLPCGSRVTLRHGNRTVTVPVVDRGPYAGNRVYDLTAATKRKLRFGSTGRVLSTR